MVPRSLAEQDLASRDGIMLRMTSPEKGGRWETLKKWAIRGGIVAGIIGVIAILAA